jgi:hypothetical protein
MVAVERSGLRPEAQGRVGWRGLPPLEEEEEEESCPVVGVVVALDGHGGEDNFHHRGRYIHVDYTAFVSNLQRRRMKMRVSQNQPRPTGPCTDVQQQLGMVCPTPNVLMIFVDEWMTVCLVQRLVSSAV